MRKILLLCLAVLLSACSTIPRPAAQTGALSAPPYDAWAHVLEKYVDTQGRVDFAGVAKDRAELDRFVAYVYDVGPNNQPQLFPTPAHVLAYHLNAYNALAMHKVIEGGVPVTLAGLRKVKFFYLDKVQVGGAPISLYDYENKVIRPLGEARVHMALNCMSVSCPRLPREPFLPETLEAQLQRETLYFVAEARNVQVDDAKQVVRLSEIFKLYQDDFLKHAPYLTNWVNRYREQKTPSGYLVEFIPYDWGINRQPGK
jgi:hypothetical protein